MTTTLSSKLAALSIALIMNLALIGGVAVLFNGKLHASVPMLATMMAVEGAASV